MIRFIKIDIVFFLIFSSCKSNVEETTANTTDGKTVLAQKAGLATAHPVATKIGADILKKGGNAIDAAIATQFALAVSYPVAGNIGGCLLYTSPSPRDRQKSRMPSSA